MSYRYEYEPLAVARIKWDAFKLKDGTEWRFPTHLRRAVQERTLNPFDHSGKFYLYDVNSYPVMQKWLPLYSAAGSLHIAWPGVRARTAKLIIETIKIQLGNDSIGVKVTHDRLNLTGVWTVERCKGWVKGSTRKL